MSIGCSTRLKADRTSSRPPLGASAAAQLATIPEPSIPMKVQLPKSRTTRWRPVSARATIMAFRSAAVTKLISPCTATTAVPATKRTVTSKTARSSLENWFITSPWRKQVGQSSGGYRSADTRLSRQGEGTYPRVAHTTGPIGPLPHSLVKLEPSGSDRDPRCRRQHHAGTEANLPG